MHSRWRRSPPAAASRSPRRAASGEGPGRRQRLPRPSVRGGGGCGMSACDDRASALGAWQWGPSLLLAADAGRGRGGAPPVTTTETGAASAVAAAQAVARAHGVACDDAVRIAGGSNVLVHLRPAPVLARVMTATAVLHADPEQWLAREVAVA